MILKRAKESFACDIEPGGVRKIGNPRITYGDVNRGCL
jgi:hypothetical protein